MSYRVIRVLLCDVPDCQTPAPYALMGDDDMAKDEGWVETESPKGVKLHVCPTCVASGRTAAEPRELTTVG